MTSTPSRRATIAGVAKLAGVSTATVSRVLSGGSPVSESTRLRVTAAVNELNYRPSELTRAVFAGRSNTIGVLLADMRNPYYIDLIDGVSGVANEAGALPYLAAGNRDVTTERRLLSLMDSHRVRGVVTTVANENEDIFHAMALAGTECVFMTRNPTIDHPRMHSVRLDDRAAGRLAWEHLASVDRTSILIVQQARDLGTVRDRTAGLVSAAREAGVEVGPEHIFKLSSLDRPSEELRDRLRAGFAEGVVNAVFATTGIATFRAYEALTATGLDVPGEVAMLGLDDFAWAEYLSPSLSVITQPTVRMGATAAQLILDEPGESQRLTFEPSITVRASTTI
ncbi:LacI family DNA-binding transcriptional regulator [Agromyces silvae]|uniref:LacI family DNA-binding transcriptional regulator n=1 Tax=Agromyces silvae TaxID=3388266 RepID=UPI00280A7EF2|nr:LacI family DNA-binding transcriptional regulator [Agromyces protaetiae]